MVVVLAFFGLNAQVQMLPGPDALIRPVSPPPSTWPGRTDGYQVEPL
jgi:hypothetical protein